MHWIFSPFQRGCVCWEGGLQDCFFSIVRGKLAATFLSGVWCWGLLGGAVSHLQAGDHPGMGLAVYFQSLCTSGYL